jgi:hypothetical protein
MEVEHYGRRIVPACPCLSSAAIILTFALTEVQEFQIPLHLPLDRTAAMIANISGPTQEDFKALAAFKTPLISDPDPGLLWDGGYSCRYHSCEGGVLSKEYLMSRGRIGEVLQHHANDSPFGTPSEPQGRRQPELMWRDTELCKTLSSLVAVVDSVAGLNSALSRLRFSATYEEMVGVWDGCYMVRCILCEYLLALQDATDPDRSRTFLPFLLQIASFQPLFLDANSPSPVPIRPDNETFEFLARVPLHCALDVYLRYDEDPTSSYLEPAICEGDPGSVSTLHSSGCSDGFVRFQVSKAEFNSIFFLYCSPIL